MSNTVQTIQAPTTNTFGLMATPAVDRPDTAREHTETAPMSAHVTALPEFGLNNTELLYAEFIPDANGAEISLNSQGNGQLFTPDQADDFADKVIVWGKTVKAMAGGARRHAKAAAEDSRSLDLAKVIAAMPEAVHGAMRKAVPDKYTPEWADAFAACMVAELRKPSTQTPCPDGIAWCEGKPVNHTNDDDHRHEGPEYNLGGSYIQGGWTEGIAGFQLAQWPDGEPHLVFQGSGTWPDLTPAQVDELIGDAVPWLVQLIATRRRIAIELKPSRTPFTESEDKQTASAAFDLATRAMDIALAKTEDRAGTLRALRSFLDMAEAEQA